jgi:hypothetical protein
LGVWQNVILVDKIYTAEDNGIYTCSSYSSYRLVDVLLG